MLIYLVTLLLVIWCLVGKWKRRHLKKLAETFKTGIKCPPIIGEFSYSFYGDKKDVMNGIQLTGRDAIQAGGAAGHWFLNKLHLTVADPEIAEIILKKCLEKDELYRFFHEITGNGSIFASVEEWRPRRKMLATTFSLKRLNQLVEIFADGSAKIVEIMKTVAGKGPFPTWNILSSISMGTALETTLGIQDTDNENCHMMTKKIDESFHIVGNRLYSPWLHSEFLYQQTSLPKKAAELKNFANGVIKNGINNIKMKNILRSNNPNPDETDRPKSFLDIVLGLSEKKSDVLIQEECVVLLAAATDTSAVAMGFTFLMLARHPDVQEKVFQELKDTFLDLDRPVEAADIHSLYYLNAVIKETMRLYPPVPIIMRKIDKHLTLPSGVNIPSGCSAVINIWALHRNPAFWGADAEEFRPERFLEPASRHPAAFVPFSYGPRNCVGLQYAMMSMKTVLASVLRCYRLMPASEDQRPLNLEYDILMKNVEKYPVRIEKRCPLP